MADNNTEAEKTAEELVEIYIPIDRTGDEGENIYVSVNGVAMFVPRGQRVKIPKPYAEVLRLADEEKGVADRYVKQASEKVK
ncbi:MAG: hypothetical protein NC213_09940 [Acetobacter sp.]|nr:hypothetical protein [Bacteroides sp.]MCM1342053.1 hypothetical protein [Acetobacter sp.]MCM1434261.1 hypothetical protein [Clostridiales bacterium]